MSDHYFKRKNGLEAKELIETAAAATLAHSGSRLQYNSLDQFDKQPSFGANIESAQFNAEYGLNYDKTQNVNETTDGEFNRDDEFNRDCASEADVTSKSVKRDNLIQLFLKGTEVDRYVSTHLYGRVKARS